MLLNDLLEKKGIDPRHVIALRHRPSERDFSRVFPWLAAERPDLFNAFQQTQGLKLESALKLIEGQGHVASFIGHEAGKALFVGLYRIASSRPITLEEYRLDAAHAELAKLGMRGFTGEGGQQSILLFDLKPCDYYMNWRGRLVVGWPPPERSWWRRAHRNEMPVIAIHEDSAIEAAMPEWDRLNLSWEELAVLPYRWREKLSQWRAIYYIFDALSKRGYVGSAYGTENLFGRWKNYAASGHGGNKLLRSLDPKHLRFSILQRVSPDMSADDVIRLEAAWKDRLHTRVPFGLNNN